MGDQILNSIAPIAFEKEGFLEYRNKCNLYLYWRILNQNPNNYSKTVIGTMGPLTVFNYNCKSTTSLLESIQWFLLLANLYSAFRQLILAIPKIWEQWIKKVK